MVAIVYTLKQFKIDLMMFFPPHMNSKQSKSQGNKDLKKDL